MTGDLGIVWTPWRVALGTAFSFGFGYLVIASIIAQPRWRTDNTLKAIAWLTGVISAWYLAGLAVFEAIGAAMDGDGGWVRVLSRIFPHLLFAAALALGVWRGLVRARNP